MGPLGDFGLPVLILRVLEAWELGKGGLYRKYRSYKKLIKISSSYFGPGSPKNRFSGFFRNFYKQKSRIRNSRVRRRFRKSRVSRRFLTPRYLAIVTSGEPSLQAFITCGRWGPNGLPNPLCLLTCVRLHFRCLSEVKLVQHSKVEVRHMLSMKRCRALHGPF